MMLFDGEDSRREILVEGENKMLERERERDEIKRAKSRGAIGSYVLCEVDVV